MNSKKVSVLILNFSLGLMILHNWLWNPQLPFLNYATNDSKMAIIQVVHVLLNVVTNFVLLKMGQNFAQQRSQFVVVINSWLLVIAIGVVETIINLLWKQQFSFADLINTFFPLTRNIVPLVMAVILGRYFLPSITKLRQHDRYQLALTIILGLGASSLFNIDIWGVQTPITFHYH